MLKLDVYSFLAMPRFDGGAAIRFSCWLSLLPRDAYPCAWRHHTLYHPLAAYFTQPSRPRRLHAGAAGLIVPRLRAGRLMMSPLPRASGRRCNNRQAAGITKRAATSQ